MSKTIGVAEKFATLFKNSKIAQLPKHLGNKDVDFQKAYPTHQIIEALPSSFSRRDFGLKVRLPKKLKSRRIIINDIDNKYGLPDFNTLNGFYWKKLRFQEMDIPVEVKGLENNGVSSPLFPGASVDADESKKPISMALHINKQSLNSKKFKKEVKPSLEKLRKPFSRWLAQKHPESLEKPDLSDEISEFVVENTRDSTSKMHLPSSYKSQLSGTAGLSYKLKGRLYQTPNGAESVKVFPGRLLQSKMTGYHFGLGGFVGHSSASQSQVKYLSKISELSKPIVGSDKFGRELKIPLVPKHAYINLMNKKLELHVDPVRSNKRYGGNNRTSLSSIKNSISPRSSIAGNDKETSVLNSLLGLLETVDNK